MEGGFHGATDAMGQVTEPGWLACGFDVAERAEPGRTWSELGDG